MHWPYFDMSSGQVFPMSEKYVEKRVTFGWRKEDIQGSLIFSVGLDCILTGIRYFQANLLVTRVCRRANTSSSVILLWMIIS